MKNMKEKVQELINMLNVQTALIDERFADTNNKIEVTLYHLPVKDLTAYAEGMKLHLYRPDRDLPHFWCKLTDEKRDRWEITMRSLRLDLTISWKEASEL